MQLDEDDTTTLNDVLASKYSRQDSTPMNQQIDTDNNNIDKLIDDNNLLNLNEDEERKRFQIELEFVQSLANPDYLNYLAQRGYFKNQTFLNYLKYLMYWKQPEYVKYITYPQCLALLELLQHENFLKEIASQQCSKYINEQLLLFRKLL